MVSLQGCYAEARGILARILRRLFFLFIINELCVGGELFSVNMEFGKPVSSSFSMSVL